MPHLSISIAQLEVKKRRLDAHGPLAPAVFNNLQEWFKVELTYTSNALEGNTLSRAETALVVEKGLTVAGKTLREHLEAVNHAEGFDWIVERRNSQPTAIGEQQLLDLHQLILHKIDDLHAGRYRSVPVRIAGSRVVMPNPAKVPALMQEFVAWLQAQPAATPQLAAEAHYRLVSIHPFVDGNGRTARLLMNWLLLQAGYPPAIVRLEDRQRYLSSIEKGQLGGSLADYYSLLSAAMERSLDIYLAAIEQNEQRQHLTGKSLLKIGELARLTQETVPTIRHWTKLGLLQVAEYTPSGYQLYEQEMVAVATEIRRLQNDRRLSLAEVGRELG